MNANRPAQPRDVPEIETDIRAFVRQESSRQVDREPARPQAEREPARPQLDKHNEPLGTNVPDLIQRVAGGSVTEIDRLIAELTQLRDHLQREGTRVESEIAAFTQTGHAAASSIKEIRQTLGRFKRAARLNAGD